MLWIRNVKVCDVRVLIFFSILKFRLGFLRLMNFISFLVVLFRMRLVIIFILLNKRIMYCWMLK